MISCQYDSDRIRNSDKDPKGYSGVFISFEGVESSGKTTQAKLLWEWLSPRVSEVVHTREPGGTVLGERIRELLLQSEEISLAPLTESLLFAAARAQLVHEVIAPTLRRGGVVLSDRFIDSSLAYQGYGLGVPLDTIWSINEAALRQATPDITFLLGRGEELSAAVERPPNDRIESRDEGFHQRVRLGFSDLACRFPDRIIVIDVGAGVEETAEVIRQCVRERMSIGC